MASKKSILWISGGVFCCFAIITMIVLLAISFKSIEATEFGIKYSSYSKKIDTNKIYDEGTHFVGPSSRFIKFPLEVKPVKFNAKDFSIRTKDGMRIQVTAAFQYKLKKDLAVSLKLLLDWGEANFESVISKNAQDSIRTSATDFNVDDFVYDKQKVDAQMKTNLDTKLGLMGVQLENFQLVEVVYPNAFKNIILNTQQQEIEVKNVINQRAKDIQEAEGRRAKASQEAQNKLLLAKSAIVDRISALDKMLVSYKTFVPQYKTILDNKKLIYGDSLWVSEYNEIINEKSSIDSNWKNINEPTPTPKVLKEMFKMKG